MVASISSFAGARGRGLAAEIIDFVFLEEAHPAIGNAPVRVATRDFNS
jgi:hypothetical protein